MVDLAALLWGLFALCEMNLPMLILEGEGLGGIQTGFVLGLGDAGVLLLRLLVVGSMKLLGKVLLGVRVSWTEPGLTMTPSSCSTLSS